MNVPIVIIQTNPSGIEACLAALTEAGLEEGRDYNLVESFNTAREHISKGGVRLLVTGSLRGNEAVAADFVKNLKLTHQRLEVWYFSLILPNRVEAYDRIITFSGLDLNHYAKLIPELKKFLATRR